MTFRVLVEQDETGMFVVNCPTLPGCISQGETRAEAIDNIKDAIKGYMESLAMSGDPVPPHITEEHVEVVVSPLPSISAREAIRAFQQAGYFVHIKPAATSSCVRKRRHTDG